MRNTKQKELILDIINKSYSHPNAYDIYLECRKVIPNISLGTVYRNLNLLVELGEIISFTCGDGSVHFDFTTANHYHFVCKTCGQIHDLPVSMVRDTSEFLTEPVDGRIDSHSVFFYGECGDCVRQKSAEQK